MSAALACVMLVGIAGCKKENEPAQAAFHYDGDTFVPDKKLTVKVWSTQGSDSTAPTQVKDNVVERWLEDTTK